MKIKKGYIIIMIIILLIGVASLEGLLKFKSFVTTKPKLDINTESEIDISKNQIEVLRTLVGLECSEMKILDNPLRINGTYKIPQETVLSYIEYYLKSTKNKDIQNVNISIEKDKLSIKAKYKLLNAFKTPIEVDILPSLTKSSQLKLHIIDIKVLGISIDEELIDAIIDSWFSKIKYIEVKNGDVIIDKENFKDIEIKEIYLEKNDVIVGIQIYLE